METRANYVLIGVFTLAVVVGVFGFVYWFQNIGGTGERAFYRVQFEGSVSGLRTGASVLFNGIRVGEVTDLKLNPQRPKQVIASISIDKSVAVRPDTEIGLEFQGLTGIAALSLKGGDPSTPPLAGAKDAKDDNPPLLIAPPGATQDVTQAARDTLRRLDDFIAENQKAFHSALDNIDKFTGALARNSDRRHLTSTSSRPAQFRPHRQDRRGPAKPHRRRRRQERRDQRGGALDPHAGRQSRQAHRRDHRRHQQVDEYRHADAVDDRQGGEELRRQSEPDHLGRRAARDEKAKKKRPTQKDDGRAARGDPPPETKTGAARGARFAF